LQLVRTSGTLTVTINMHGILSYAVAALVGSAVAAPVTPVHPGNANSIVITSQDTVNATNPAPSNATSSGNSTKLTQIDVVETAGGQPLALSFFNNFSGGTINAYVTGLDSNSELVMLLADGTFYYPTANASDGTPQDITVNSAIPLDAQSDTMNITIPGYISASRIWFADGDLKFFTVYNSAAGGPSLVEPSSVNPSDPSAAVNWGFVELTWTSGGLYADISYVDFVGLPLGISLTVGGGGSTQGAEGLAADSVSTICANLTAQAAKDGQPWGDLCQVDSAGTPLRVIAPSDYLSLNPDAFEDYFTDYVNDVWTHYTTNNLTIDTQAAAGNVTCQVETGSGNLTCAGDNRGYPKPTAGDIFGCNSGPFAIEAGDNAVHYAVVPRLCAAFDRTTLLIPGGDVQPGPAASTYYQQTPTNWYSAFVHASEVDGKGYAFAYDDVTPDGGVNQSGVVASDDPTCLEVIVGGPLSSGSGW